MCGSLQKVLVLRNGCADQARREIRAHDLEFHLFQSISYQSMSFYFGWFVARSRLVLVEGF